MAVYTGAVKTMLGQTVICEECEHVLQFASGRAWDAGNFKPIEFSGAVSCPTPGCKGNIAERMEATCEGEVQWLEFMDAIWPKREG